MTAPPDLVISALNYGDVSPVARLVHVCSGTERVAMAATFRRQLARGDADGPLFKAVLSGTLVGYGRVAHFTPRPESPREVAPAGWYLLGLAVLPQYRRRGIAMALTLKRLAWLRERARTVYYFTEPENVPSQQLHAGLGFRRTREGVFFPPSHSGVVLYSLECAQSSRS